MQTKLMKFIIFVCLHISYSNCYNYLILSPVAAKSIIQIYDQIAVALTENGHNVTFIHSIERMNVHTNVQEITTGATFDVNSMNYFTMKDPSQLYKTVNPILKNMLLKMWSNKLIQSLQNDRHKFDAIITLSHANEIGFPFFIDYKGAIVFLAPAGVDSNLLGIMGNLQPSSALPYLQTPYNEEMTFIERVHNVLVACLERLPGQTFFPEDLQSTLKEFYPELGSINDYYSRASLFLINGYFGLDSPMPLLPNQVEIGTINAFPAKPLPKEMEDFVRGSGDDGVIYFSLGSSAKSTDIPVKVKTMFLEAFRELPQRVVWKYEGTDLDLPSNVRTYKWVPQQDVLGHDKTKVFISHCGNLGTQEAKYHGVPVLAVPIIFDQPRNAAKMARKGYAIMLNWEDMTKESIIDGIKELIENKEYSQRLQQVSRMLQYQKESPVERAVWWLEFVVHHHGAPQLVYPGSKLNFFQYILLDVIAVLGIILIVICAITYYTCKFSYRRTKVMYAKVMGVKSE